MIDCNNTPRVYCERCGEKLIQKQETVVERYDHQTGKAYKHATFSCPNKKHGVDSHTKVILRNYSTTYKIDPLFHIPYDFTYQILGNE